MKRTSGSWNSYIDNLIAMSPACDRGCIIGLDGGEKWTSDSHPNALKITPTEGATIARAFKAKDFSTFRSNGIVVAGIKYHFLRVEDDKVVFGKKKGYGAITLQSSKTAIVIGHTKEGGQQGDTNQAVDFIAGYFESLGL